MSSASMVRVVAMKTEIYGQQGYPPWLTPSPPPDWVPWFPWPGAPQSPPPQKEDKRDDR